MTSTATAATDQQADLTCEFVESFEDGKCGSRAEFVTIGKVSVALCQTHEDRAREENEDR